MFLFRLRGVVFALVLFMLFAYLIISGRYEAARPWVDGTIFVVIGYIFVRMWFR